MNKQDNNIDETLNKSLKMVPSVVCGFELAITLIIYSLLKHYCGLVFGEFFIIVVLAYYIHNTMKLAMPEIEKELKTEREKLYEKDSNQENKDIEDKSEKED